MGERKAFLSECIGRLFVLEIPRILPERFVTVSVRTFSACLTEQHYSTSLKRLNCWRYSRGSVLK